MATWETTPPELPAPAKIAEALIRVMRLDVIRKIQVGEQMAVQFGVSPLEFQRLRHLVQELPLDNLATRAVRAQRDRDRGPVKHLAVRVIEGSAF